MCRWAAYAGPPVFLEEMILSPAHSLIEQSQRASEAKTAINGDGFGLAWYGERKTPGLYRDILPAWADTNLRSLASQIRSPPVYGSCARINRRRHQSRQLSPLCL